METVVKIVNKIRKHSLVHRQFKSFISEIDEEYCDLVYFSQIRWLSKGKCLKRFFDNYHNLDNFFKTVIKKPVPQLSEIQWYFELAFLTDLTQILNQLKLKIMGTDKLISEQYKEVKLCKQTIVSFSERFKTIQSLSINTQFDFSDLQCVEKVIEEKRQNNFSVGKIVTFLRDLLDQFDTRFSDFKQQELFFDVFENPFEASPVPIELQFEVRLLKSDPFQRDLFQKSSNLLEFYSNINPSNFPSLIRNASKCVSHFGSTYRCESLFGRLKSRKTSITNRLSDDTLTACLRISISGLKPNFSKLVSKARLVSD